MMLIAKDSRSE